MNRTTLLLLVFMLLGGFSFFLMKNQDGNSTVSNNPEGDFKVENADDIYKIFIAERNGKKTTLERKGKDWIYDGLFKTRPNVMERLLETVTQVEMYYTTPRAAEKNMLNNLATNGIKVEIYGKENNLMKAYYVGASTADGYGTFMIMEGAKEPFITHVPNFKGMLRGRFSKMREDDWRDRTIFGEEVDNIESVEVEYPRQKNKSFKLIRGDNGFEVTPFNPASPKINRPVSQAKIEKYLLGFRSLMAEDFETNFPKRDSITALLPFAKIALKNKKGEGMAANFHPLIRRNDAGDILTKVNSEGLSTETTVRYYVNCSDESFRLAQHRVFSPIFRGYDFFFEK